MLDQVLVSGEKGKEMDHTPDWASRTGLTHAGESGAQIIFDGCVTMSDLVARMLGEQVTGSPESGIIVMNSPDREGDPNGQRPAAVVPTTPAR